MKTTDKPIILSFDLKSSPHKIWNALTDLNEMKQWYFNNLESFKPEVGFKTQFKITSEGRIFTHQWEVTEVIPLKKITYNWHFAEYTGGSRSTFDLTENQDFVTLKLAVKTLKDFPDNIPEFTNESCINGWQYFIGKNLTAYLKSNN